MERYDVIIVGAGLAGCSAAIQLGTKGHKVLLLEQKTYPVHKLCGEFLSVEVQGYLRELGVLDAVRAKGAHPITKTRITAQDGAVFESDLPGEALGISRYTLDLLLVEAAQEANVDVKLGTRVRAILHPSANVHTVITSEGSFYGAYVLGAFGKRSVLDRTLKRDFLQMPTPYVAFKAHYDGIAVPQTIELHAFDGGYCGVSHVEDGVTNMCWIGHETNLHGAGGKPEGMIEAVLKQNPHLAERFEQGEQRFSAFKAISQITFVQKEVVVDDIWMLGDAVCMITPLCGDGMAMALRSAELAVPLVEQAIGGAMTREVAAEAYRKTWSREFKKRLQLGRYMHRIYEKTGWADRGIRLLNRVPAIGRWIIAHTRG